MKKFVILFLLLASLLFPTLTHAAETIIPEVILAPAVEIVIDDVIEVQTFAVDLTEPEITTAQLPTEAELRCMQENLYFEARSEGTRGMIAVANVTMNRTRDSRYPPTVCGVVQQKTRTSKGRLVCQFSWFCEPKTRNGPRLLLAAELEAWHEAGKIALAAFNGTLDLIVGNATHYHATYVRPKWSRSSLTRRIARIGTHIFYYERVPL